MATSAFPRINDMPSYALQQDQLRRAGWGSFPAISYDVPPPPFSLGANQVNARTASVNQRKGVFSSTAGSGRGFINPALVQPTAMPAIPSLPSVTSAPRRSMPASQPMNTGSGYVPITAPMNADYGFSPYNAFDGLRVGRQDGYSPNFNAMGGAPVTDLSVPYVPDGSMWDGFSNLLTQGKDAWNNNKDWLIGNKEQAGVLPVGLGLFNAFNQYSVGKANINAMKEQNALARGAFQLNKTGALADYEDASAKLARKQYFAQNPNATPSQVYEAAKLLTEERMKRFK